VDGILTKKKGGGKNDLPYSRATWFTNGKGPGEVKHGRDISGRCRKERIFGQYGGGVDKIGAKPEGVADMIPSLFVNELVGGKEKISRQPQIDIKC